jgi:hypothetical protein
MIKPLLKCKLIPQVNLITRPDHFILKSHSTETELVRSPPNHILADEGEAGAPTPSPPVVGAPR